MYELRLDGKLTKSMFTKWSKETRDWVVNAIASLVIVDQVVEPHEVIALQEAISLLDSRNEIENMMQMVKQRKMLDIEDISVGITEAADIYFYLASIAVIDGKMKKVEAELLKSLGDKLGLPEDFQRAVMKWAISQMENNRAWNKEQAKHNQEKERLLTALVS